MSTILLAFISTIILLLTYNFGKFVMFKKTGIILKLAGDDVIKKLDKLDKITTGKSEEELKTLLEESTRLGGQLEGITNIMEEYLDTFGSTRIQKDGE